MQPLAMVDIYKYISLYQSFLKGNYKHSRKQTVLQSTFETLLLKSRGFDYFKCEILTQQIVLKIFLYLCRRGREYRHVWDQIRRSFCPADRLPEFQGEPKLEPIKMPGILRILRSPPPLRSWTLARASISSILFPFGSPFLPLSIPYLFVLLAGFLLPPLRSAGTFLVLSRSPSKTNQIFGEVLAQPSRRRRWLPGALNVTVSSHVKNGKSTKKI